MEDQVSTHPVSPGQWTSKSEERKMDKAHPVLPLLQFLDPPSKQIIKRGKPKSLRMGDLRQMTTVREVAMTKSARRMAESPTIVAISPV